MSAVVASARAFGSPASSSGSITFSSAVNEGIRWNDWNTNPTCRPRTAARLAHYPRQLSGGEQQRVAIARAFVARPPLLFADEPTGNLDAATGRRVAQLLFERNRAAGSTLVLVTHDRELAARCDRVVELDAGRVVG